MKISIPCALAVHLLFSVAAHAAPTYSIEDLGPAEGPGAYSGAFLNNRGEVLYGHGGDLGFWLPRPHYGLPAGFNDLLQLPRDTSRHILSFSDDGFVYSQILLPHDPFAPGTDWAVLLKASAQGESEFAKVFVYKSTGIFPGINEFNDRDGRQRFVANGVAGDGTPWGNVDIQIKFVVEPESSYEVGNAFRPYAAYAGVFRGSQFFSVPGEATFPECDGGGYKRYWYYAASPSGTFLTSSLDSCLDLNQNPLVYAQTLAVVGPNGARIISTKGTDLPTPAFDPELNTEAARVNDRGDAAGLDAAGLWYSSADGKNTRLPVTAPFLNGDLLLNNSGWLLFQADPVTLAAVTLWDGQTAVPLGLPWKDWGFADAFFPRAFNTRGEILGRARSAADNLLHSVLLSPILTLDLAASSGRIAIGDRFTVTATVTNISRDQLTLLSPKDLLEYTGKGGLELITGPLPATVPVLDPDGRTQFTWTLQATNAGDVRFSVAVQGKRGPNTVESVPASTGLVHLVDRSADLLIKPADAPDAAFAIAGFQVPTAVGAQLQTLIVKSNQPALYDVRLRNVGKETRSFTLLALENGAQAVPGWQRTYSSGNQDLTTALTSPAGYETPKISTNEVFDLRLSLTPTNVPVNGRFTVAVVATDAEDASTAMDAVEVQVTQAQIPISVAMRRLTEPGLTVDSIRDGQSNPDAPLIPVTDASLLATQPVIHGGLVADGVTPLLFELEADPVELEARPGPQKFQLRATVKDGGDLEHATLASRLRVLHGSEWTADLKFQLTSAQPRAWAYLTPIEADDVRLKGSPELSLLLEVVSDDADLTLHASQGVRLRHPPLALIHGYNTAGDWGGDVLGILSAARGGGIGTEDSFVRICRYGTDPTEGALGLLTYGKTFENTMYPLRTLVPMAEDAFRQGVAPLRVEWAFTRHDVVAHSQGGLLTRMLCSKSSNAYLSEPFRNKANFYRGRFHRVVTIGSPHNGSRLLRYLLALERRNPAGFNLNIPADVASVMVLADVAQQKFDPFGDQIRELNSQDPDGPWQPDPMARFHMVRALINGGRPPDFLNYTPADFALNLNDLNGEGGRRVIPRGSDGVVDFDSMGAQGPGQPQGANVFNFDVDVPTSHAPPVFLWSAVSAETDSVGIALHVIAALDQNPTLPATNRVFGRFVPPPLLTSDISDGIDGWAGAAVPVTNPPRPVGGPAALAGDGGMTYTFRLPDVPDQPFAGDVLWSAVAFGPTGLTRSGLDLTEPNGDSTRVTLGVAPEVVGDVVLYVSYRSSTGKRVYAAPALVATQGIDEANIAAIAVLPDNLSLPASATVPVEIYSQLADGRWIQRFAAPAQIQVSSSAPAVIDTTDPLLWTTHATGSAELITSFAGLKATNRLDVFAAAPTAPPLLLSALLDGNDLVLSWPAAIAATLQSAATYDAADWQPVAGSPQMVGDSSVLRAPVGAGPRFFRLLRTGPIDPGGTPQERLGGIYAWNRSGAGGNWSDPANWDSTAPFGAAPIADGLAFVDITFGTAADPVASTIDGVFGIHGVTFTLDAPDQHLTAGAGARLDLGSGGLSKFNLGNVTVDATVRLASDQTWQIESGTLSLVSLDLQSRALTITGSGALVVQALGGSTGSRFVVQGPGRVDVGGGPAALPFSGAITVTGGSLNPGLNPINGAAAIEVGGGTLSFPSNVILASAAEFRLPGGTVLMNGASGNLGALEPSGMASLKLGAGNTELHFTGSSPGPAGSRLLVSDWTGIAGASGTGRRLLISPAPTATLLGQITFDGPDFAEGSMRLASGEIVPLFKPPSVLPANPLAQALAYGAGESRSLVAVTGQPFSETQALQIVTTQKPAQLYGVGVTLKTGAPVAANDNLVASFWIRRIAPAAANAQVTFNFELASGSFDKSISSPITLSDGNWQQKTIKFKSKAAYAAGAAEVSFWAGFAVQTVQIGALELINYKDITPP